MREFAGLVQALDASTATLDKVAAMRAHFQMVPKEDCAWAIYFLSGGKPRRLVPTQRLREAAYAAARMPAWLFEECYGAVGDLAETIALLLPEPNGGAQYGGAQFGGLDRWMRERVIPLRALDAPACMEALQAYWAELNLTERFVFNKLITGGLRLGVSRQLALRALGEAFGVDPRLLAQRIIGYTDGSAEPDKAQFDRLIAPDESTAQSLLPYPFFLANSWDDARASASQPEDWLVEWKWDGIRAQIVRRADGIAVWSRGEELLTNRFPEIIEAAQVLPPGSVIDGELLCWRAGESRPMDFAAMQTRIGRHRPGPATLRQSPAVFCAFDCLEHAGSDLRSQPLFERRARLLDLIGNPDAGEATLRVARALPAQSWTDCAQWRAQARSFGAEGVMLKRRDSPYGIGRSVVGGGWFKWKLDPYSVDAVLVYAQAGHGRRAGLYTDYTFAVWAQGEDGSRQLVPFAKAYSGLTDAEIREVDAIIRRTTIERFGPVRSVEPSLVFEIGFEGIARSGRHRAGVSVRFPRILRWRKDKELGQADTLASLQALLVVSRA